MIKKKTGQYTCIKQTASSDFKVLSRDRVSSFRYKMHVIMFAWDPALGFMKHLEHLKFLEYLLCVKHVEGRQADGR